MVHMRHEHTAQNAMQWQWNTQAAAKNRGGNGGTTVRRRKTVAFECADCDFRAGDKPSMVKHISEEHRRVDVPAPEPAPDREGDDYSTGFLQMTVTTEETEIEEEEENKPLPNPAPAPEPDSVVPADPVPEPVVVFKEEAVELSKEDPFDYMSGDFEPNFDPDGGGGDVVGAVYEDEFQSVAGDRDPTWEDEDADDAMEEEERVGAGKCRVRQDAPLLECPHSDCDFTTYNKLGYNKHLNSRRHAPGAGGRGRSLACPVASCEYRAFLAKEMREHCAKEHPEVLHRCPEPGCHFATHSLQGYRYHLSTNKHGPQRQNRDPDDDGDGDESTVCLVAGCGVRVETARGLRQHYGRLHPEALHKCPEEGCEVSCISEEELERHLVERGRPHKRTLECRDCDYVANGFHELRWAFYFVDRVSIIVQSFLLSMHVRTKHPLSKNYPARCDHCDYITVTNTALRHHVMRVHPDLADDASLKKCHQCDFRTMYLGEFKDHM